MPRYVAFLRAINVGGHVVKMEHLRGLFASMGLANVETFIASGNVIFETPVKKAADLERRIEARLRDDLGYPVATFLRSVAEVAEIAAYQPFRRTKENRSASLYIGFLQDEPSRESQRKVLSLRSTSDDLHVRWREVYWLCRTKLLESAVSGALMEKTVGGPATWRNSTTVSKIAAKYCRE